MKSGTFDSLARALSGVSTRGAALRGRANCGSCFNTCEFDEACLGGVCKRL